MMIDINKYEAFIASVYVKKYYSMGYFIGTTFLAFVFMGLFLLAGNVYGYIEIILAILLFIPFAFTVIIYISHRRSLALLYNAIPLIEFIYVINIIMLKVETVEAGKKVALYTCLGFIVIYFLVAVFTIVFVKIRIKNNKYTGEDMVNRRKKYEKIAAAGVLGYGAIGCLANDFLPIQIVTILVYIVIALVITEIVKAIMRTYYVLKYKLDYAIQIEGDE